LPLEVADLIRVVVVDDHSIVREGIKSLLASEPDIRVVGTGGSGQDAVALFDAMMPDVIVIDMHMPGMTGLDVIADIRSRSATVRFVVLTGYSGDAIATKAITAGANGYLLKSGALDDVAAAVRAVHRGERFICTDMADAIAASKFDRPLSARELDVLNLVSRGQSSPNIARTLNITDETVKAHLKSIFAKLGVSGRTHAVTLALKRGFLDPS
jgi:DNA-binding NarL/FixJ family response regulator